MSSPTAPADATLVDLRAPPDHSLAVTQASPVAVTDDRSARAGLASAVRTTVLPRLEVVGDTPRLVSDVRARFETAEVLGRGGVGEVSLARDNDIDRPVAVKRLLPELDDPGLVARFVDEIRVLGQLDHPNIVPIHDVGVDADGRYFYVMKYVEGETLEHVVDRLVEGDPEYHRRYTFERRVEVFRQILRGVQYAHSRGVIHRDIKPANVMVGRFGEVVVMDWGLARKVHDERSSFPVSDKAKTLTAPAAPRGGSPKLRTQVGALLGTPAYMSPEQAKGEVERIDERSDVYALCVMFHEMLTLEHYLARKGTVTEALAGVLRDPVPFATGVKSPHQGSVPAELAHFIAHGVSKDPAGRYRSVTEMLDRLQSIEEGHCPVECPATFAKRMNTEIGHMVDRRPLVMLGVALAVIAMAVGGLGLLVATRA